MSSNMIIAPPTRRRAFNLLLFLIHLNLVNCQQSETTTVQTTTSDIGLSTTTDSEVLLSREEFIDLTETPVILFDGTSNEQNDNLAQPSSTSSPETSENVQLSTVSPQTNGTNTESTKATESVPDTETMEKEEEEADEGAPEAGQPFDPPQTVAQYMDYIERLFHDLRHQVTDLFEPHIPELIRTSQMVQLSSLCSYDMLRMALALREFEPWALRMIDSSGKFPEGIFEGSFTALGSYDECLSTVFATPTAATEQQQAPKSSPTLGKYCLVNVSPFLPPKPPADRVEHMFAEEADRRNYTKDDQFSRLSPMFYYMKFRIGVCIPSTCQDSDMDSISSALSTRIRLNITIPHCRVKQSQPITTHQLISGLVFGLVLVVVSGATIVDYLRRKSGKMKDQEIIMLGVGLQKEVTELPTVILSSRDKASSAGGDLHERLNKHWKWMSFSSLANYKLYFEQKSTQVGGKCQSKEIDNESMIIRCLNGIRVLSLCWVIVANSYITLDPRATKRLTETREAPKDFLFQVVAQASLAIETFFFLSGILFSVSFARKLKSPVLASENQGSPDRKESQTSARLQSSQTVRWLHFYLHRYIRMTPATMLVIALAMFTFRYGDGPLWFEATHKAHQSCSQNWWRHLLHVANFIDTRQMCFIHYWYIAADMQLFIFAPPLMALLYYRRRVGYALVTLIGLMSISSVFYSTYIHNLPPTLLFYNSDPESRREFGNTIMTKPLTHALPYMVGMIVGKWLISDHLSESTGSKCRRPVTTLLGMMATLVALAEVFLPYKWNNSHLPTRFLASLYAALFRFGWSLVLAYLVVSCRHKRDKRCQGERSSGDCACVCENKSLPPRLNWLNDDQCSRMCLCGSGGSLLNRLLSLNIFSHLSKLSFVAYLIHLPIMSVFVAQTRGLFAFSHTLVIHLALSYLVMTFIISFVLVHIIELPFITFERYLFDKLFYKADSIDVRPSRQFSRQRGAQGMYRATTNSENSIKPPELF